MLLRHLTVCCLLLLLPSFAHAKIVFRSVVRGAGAGLYVIDDDGLNVRRLTDDGWWPAWSPDGKQIAFSEEPPGAPKWPQKAATYIINSDGSDLHRLTNEDTNEWGSSWSPDGRHIAFSSNRLVKEGTGQKDIWTLNLRTKEMRQLTRTDGLTTEPAWSPDGKYIAYRDDSPNGQFTVYIMRANGDTQRELAPGHFFRRRSFPRWSPDSQSVVYIEDTFDHGVGGRLVTLSRKAVIHHIKTNKRRVVDTPDDWSIHSACFMGSKQLLISAKGKDGKPAKYDIYRYHLVTGEIVNLTNTPGDDFAMDWISDDVLSVTPQGKKKVTWGALKQ